ncbi:efflux RND transporter periplasmic adaptor subunit [Ectothiorhodosinus mongolicus]|nr:efflux RND transporter periplasmic adaptor subunit [Ectothiorhodosinus mongolicus]
MTLTENKKKALVLGLGAIGALLVFLWLQSGDEADTAPTRAAASVAVTASDVMVQDITQQLRVSGTLAAAQRVEIPARVAGRLNHLAVDIGDTVRSGDLLAELEDDIYRQEYSQAQAERDVSRANLAEAEAALAQTRRALERTRELRAQGIAAQLELETAETDVAAQEARVQLAASQIAQREAALENARTRLTYTRLIADGDDTEQEWQVADRFVDVGSILQANTPVMALVTQNPLRAQVFVTERDYAFLSSGQSARIVTIAWPDEDFMGRVKRIAPEFREASRQARVEIEVPNDQGRLRPGMFVEVRIATRTVSDAVTVPIDALITRDGRQGVYLLERDDDDDLRARFVAITPGIEEAGRLQVVSPELSGRVVTLGQHLLSDGTRVRVSR